MSIDVVHNYFSVIIDCPSIGRCQSMPITELTVIDYHRSIDWFSDHRFPSIGNACVLLNLGMFFFTGIFIATVNQQKIVQRISYITWFTSFRRPSLLSKSSSTARNEHVSEKNRVDWHLPESWDGIPATTTHTSPCHLTQGVVKEIPKAWYWFKIMRLKKPVTIFSKSKRK